MNDDPGTERQESSRRHRVRAALRASLAQHMSAQVHTLLPSDPVGAAAELMERTQTRHVVLVDRTGSDESVIGVISDRDVLLALAPDDGLLDLDGEQRRREQFAQQRAVPLRRIMAQDVITANPEQPISEALQTLIRAGIGCLPVVAGAPPALAGMLTSTDGLRLLLDLGDAAEAVDGSTTTGSLLGEAATLMREAPGAPIGPETPLFDAFALLRDRRLHHVVVLDERRRPVGMLSDRDILRVLPLPDSLSADGGAARGLLGRINPTRPDIAPALWRRCSELMTGDPVVLPRGATVLEGTRAMLRWKISAIPMVNPDGTLAGVLTQTGLLGALLTAAGLDVPRERAR